MFVTRAIVGSERVLLSSLGQVWRPGVGWTLPEAEVLKVGKPYFTWSDVPHGWAGGNPYWRAR